MAGSSARALAALVALVLVAVAVIAEPRQQQVRREKWLTVLSRLADTAVACGS